MSQELSDFLAQLKNRYPAETEFHQAVTEVSKSVWSFIEKNPKYRKARILERLTEPERASWLAAKANFEEYEQAWEKAYKMGVVILVEGDDDEDDGDPGPA